MNCFGCLTIITNSELTMENDRCLPKICSMLFCSKGVRSTSCASISLRKESGTVIHECWKWVFWLDDFRSDYELMTFALIVSLWITLWLWVDDFRSDYELMTFALIMSLWLSVWLWVDDFRFDYELMTFALIMSNDFRFTSALQVVFCCFLLYATRECEFKLTSSGDFTVTRRYNRYRYSWLFAVVFVPAVDTLPTVVFRIFKTWWQYIFSDPLANTLSLKSTSTYKGPI